MQAAQIYAYISAVIKAWPAHTSIVTMPREKPIMSAAPETTSHLLSYAAEHRSNASNIVAALTSNIYGYQTYAPQKSERRKRIMKCMRLYRRNCKYNENLSEAAAVPGQYNDEALYLDGSGTKRVMK